MLAKWTACSIFVFFSSFVLIGCEKTEKGNLGLTHKFIAFSLKNACLLLKKDSSKLTIDSLAGISRIGGFIVDSANDDIILVGLADNKQPKSKFDDFVTALRSRFIYNEFPLVSIDPVEDTYTTRQQRVRFDGHLEQTHFGLQLLKCDILLKKYSLNLLSPIESVPNYRQLFENESVAKLKSRGYTNVSYTWVSDGKSNSEIQSYTNFQQIERDEYNARFWYYPKEPIVNIYRNGVFLIRDLNIGLKAQGLFSNTKSQTKANDEFANDFTAHYDLLSDRYPALKYLKTLYDFTAVATALSDSVNLIHGNKFKFFNFLISDYQSSKVYTPATYKLEEMIGKAKLKGGLVNLISVSGGIVFGNEVKMLNYGDYGELKKIVIKSRPLNTALFWQLPISGWIMPNTNHLDNDIETDTATQVDGSYGSFLRSQSATINESIHPISNQSRFNGFANPPPSIPTPLKGVSMEMTVDNSAFKPGGKKLQDIKNQILSN